MLEEQDSGTDALPVVYTAYEEEAVRINGGYNLPVSSYEIVAVPAILELIPQDALAHVRHIDLQ
jgi:hypothetical protein